MSGDLAPRSLVCLAIGSQQHEPRHSVRSARRRCRQRRWSLHAAMNLTRGAAWRAAKDRADGRQYAATDLRRGSARV
eukprot:5775443-Prymnesium_polylepis.1